MLLGRTRGRMRLVLLARSRRVLRATTPRVVGTGTALRVLESVQLWTVSAMPTRL
ncbi:hypothetical protein EV651_10168 [Kribbella sp. VKM Ac-2571]|nr:hypothetical protein EV651_10168 [Kribbella sp. VKM Ac-2571]